MVSEWPHTRHVFLMVYSIDHLSVKSVHWVHLLGFGGFGGVFLMVYSVDPLSVKSVP